MHSHIIGIPVALIFLYLIKNKWLSFLVAFIAVGLFEMTVAHQFATGNDIHYNWGALPEIGAGVLGFFIVDFAIAYLLYYIGLKFLGSQKEPAENVVVDNSNKKSVSTTQDNILALIGGSAILVLFGWLVYTMITEL